MTTLVYELTSIVFVVNFAICIIITIFLADSEDRKSATCLIAGQAITLEIAICCCLMLLALREENQLTQFLLAAPEPSRTLESLMYLAYIGVSFIGFFLMVAVAAIVLVVIIEGDCSVPASRLILFGAVTIITAATMIACQSTFKSLCLSNSYDAGSGIQPATAIEQPSETVASADNASDPKAERLPASTSGYAVALQSQKLESGLVENAAVKNIGDEKCAVTLTVQMPTVTLSSLSSKGDVVATLENIDAITCEINDEWVQEGEPALKDGCRYYTYRYIDPLGPGETTAPLYEDLQVEATISEDARAALESLLEYYVACMPAGIAQ